MSMFHLKITKEERKYDKKKEKKERKKLESQSLPLQINSNAYETFSVSWKTISQDKNKLNY